MKVDEVRMNDRDYIWMVDGLNIAYIHISQKQNYENKGYKTAMSMIKNIEEKKK